MRKLAFLSTAALCYYNFPEAIFFYFLHSSGPSKQLEQASLTHDHTTQQLKIKSPQACQNFKQKL
jgi:hypothetical protein